MADLMFCLGTQVMDNSRICHCLLFHEHGNYECNHEECGSDWSRQYSANLMVAASSPYANGHGQYSLCDRI